MTITNYEALRNSTLPKQLANEHWAWVVRWLEIVYKDAFEHGYKHGREDALQENNQEQNDATQ